MNELFWRAELLCWDNEGAGEGTEGGGDDAAAQAAADAAAAQAAADAAAAGKTFTQDELNKIVGKEKMAVKEKYAEMETAYQDLLKQQNLTKEQRDKLEANLDRVRSEMMTKEQRLEEEKKKAQKKHQEELSVAQQEADKYKSLFENSTIERAIQDASAKHDAYSPTQFIAHLAPKSKMVEEVDAEGNLTGQLVPRVVWSAVDEEGKTHQSEITPEEAVQKMKENVVDFGNLFKTNVAAGIGQGTAPGQLSPSGDVDHKRISDAEYMELAKTPEGRKKLGLSR